VVEKLIPRKNGGTAEHGVVEGVCNRLKREGIPSYIDAQDLLQVGYEALIYTVHKDPTYHGTIPLASRVARNARTAMVRFIERRRRETRYVQVARTRANLGPECKAQGAQGVICPEGDRDGQPGTEGGDGLYTRIFSLESRKVPSTGARQIYGWNDFIGKIKGRNPERASQEERAEWLERPIYREVYGQDRQRNPASTAEVLHRDWLRWRRWFWREWHGQPVERYVEAEIGKRRALTVEEYIRASEEYRWRYHSWLRGVRFTYRDKYGSHFHPFPTPYRELPELLTGFRLPQDRPEKADTPYCPHFCSYRADCIRRLDMRPVLDCLRKPYPLMKFPNDPVCTPLQVTRSMWSGTRVTTREGPKSIYHPLKVDPSQIFAVVQPRRWWPRRDLSVKPPATAEHAVAFELREAYFDVAIARGRDLVALTEERDRLLSGPMFRHRQLKIVTLPLVPPGKESSGRRELIRLSRLAA
jgi:hypothetical protein